MWYPIAMHKKKDTQKLVNIILIVAVSALALYSAGLTYIVHMHQWANESVDESLANQLFQLHIKDAQQSE